MKIALMLLSLTAGTIAALKTVEMMDQAAQVMLSVTMR
jgi:hypothetical protein